MDQLSHIINLASVWVIPVVIAITFHEAAHGFVAHFFGDAELLCKPTTDPVSGRGRSHVMGCPALDDGSVEQPLRSRHRQKRGDAHGTRRLPKDRDLPRVPAKPGSQEHPMRPLRARQVTVSIGNTGPVAPCAAS